MRKLFERIRDWKDRRFLKRLERVMQNNVIHAHLGIAGEFVCYEKHEKGVPPLPKWMKVGVAKDTKIDWDKTRKELDELHYKMVKELDEHLIEEERSRHNPDGISDFYPTRTPDEPQVRTKVW